MSDTAELSTMRWPRMGHRVLLVTLPSWVIHRMEVDTVPWYCPRGACRTLVCVCAPSESKEPAAAPKDLKQECVCHMNTESSKSGGQRNTFLELWVTLLPLWLGAHLVSRTHLLSCTSPAPRACQSHLFPPHQM